MDIKEKVSKIWWNIKWKYSVKDWVWKKHTKALFQPGKQFTTKFWKWLYNRLRGDFTVNTKYREFGINWNGFLNFDICLGAFCRITLFWCRDAKTFLASFLTRYYKDSFFTKGKGRLYFAYVFGHELKSEYTDNKFVYHSAWRWGRYLPWARDVNIRRTEKLFGIIGWGETKKKKPLFEFRNPPFSWITPKYVRDNCWAICSSCPEEGNCPGGQKGCHYTISRRTLIPLFPKNLLKPGDVLIFFDYKDRARFEQRGEIEINGQKMPIIIDHGEEFESTDRYQIITEEFLQQWKEEELGSPDAVVVRAPNLPGPKKENAIAKFLKKR